MNVLSLFSGIGGLELGLERAGMTVVGQVEFNPWCRQVLAKHWPEVPKHDDVRTAIEWWRGEPRPPVHVVAGGFPCQPVSVAGLQLAQADERWLWPAAFNVVRDLRPQWALLENVPGLLARGMGDVLGDLAAIGYDAEWDCIPAAALGAHHRRDRVFVVAYPNGSAERLQPVAKPRGGGQALAGVDGTHRDVADADSAGLGERRRSVPDAPQQPAAERRREGLADADSQRRNWRPRIFGQGWRGQPADGRWWPAEPDVGRVAHGVPARVDRLRGLGNAVVPQVSEYIGRLVMAHAGMDVLA